MATQASLNFVQQLYVAYYGRPADSAGLQYWADRVEAEDQGFVVRSFGNSQEFQDEFGELSNEELVNNLYQQLFSRDAEEAGLDYYVGVLASGEKTLAEIALTISNAAQGSDRIVLNTKVQAADYYTSNIADANYDASSAKDLLASIDEVNTGADFDSVVDQIDSAEDVSGIAANYKALQAAEAAEELADKNLTDALTDLDENSELGYDASATGTTALEVSDVQKFVTTAENNLNSAIAADGTDAELAQDVEDAEAAIRAVEGEFNADGTDATGAGNNLTAGDLLDNYQEAVAAFEADVEADGETKALATDLNAAVAAYLANNDDTDGSTDGTGPLGTLQTAATNFIASNGDAAAVTTFLGAVATAQDAIFSGEDDASVLTEGSAGDSVESLVTTLDERNELNGDVSTSLSALRDATNDTTVDATGLVDELFAAQTAVESRAEARADLEEAQGDLASLKELQDAVTAAQNEVTAAEEDLGFTVEMLDNGTEAGDTDGTADLFVFDKEATIDSTITLGSDDALYLGAGYSLGDAENADDSQLEVFFNEDTGVLTVEKFADGDTTNVDLSLTTDGTAAVTGVSLNDDGVLTIA